MIRLWFIYYVVGLVVGFVACSKVEAPTGDVPLDQQCMVSRYKVFTPGVAENPREAVCAILCQWYAGNHGYVTTVPVPCSWYGQPVIVDRWVSPINVLPVKVSMP